MRVPVDQPLVAVDQALLVAADEHLAHGGGQALVQGEALAAPVAGGAQAAQLAHDGPAALGLPLPDLARRRPRGPCRGGRCCPLAASWRSTTIWVAMPAWSVPGSHRAALPRMRSKRVSTSCRVLFSAWPMCSEPVTLGGGMTMENGSARRRPRVGAKAPDASQRVIEARLGGLGVEGLFEHRLEMRALRARDGCRMPKASSFDKLAMRLSNGTAAAEYA